MTAVLAILGIACVVAVWALDDPSQQERDAWDLDGGYNTDAPRVLAMLVAVLCIAALAVL